MGAVLVKFKKKKATADVLEALEEKIKQLENYTLNTQEQKNRFVGNFLAVSIGVYVIGFVIFYFVYFPPTWNERFLYSLPLLIFPIVIILLRKLFTWYFQRKLNNNSIKLTGLRAEKKKILEKVMDKETYKVAVNLLSRYGERSNFNRLLYTKTDNSNTSPQYLSSTIQSEQSPSGNNQLNTLSYLSPLNRPKRPLQIELSSVARAAELKPMQNVNDQELRRRTPFPIVNQQDKGVFERIVDVLVGDGPQDRFAMICKQCYAHNGMALKEDFEYTTFRCAFCNALNPSRKARPIAPRLPLHQCLRTGDQVDSSDSTPSSDVSGDEETSKSRISPHILSTKVENEYEEKMPSVATKEIKNANTLRSPQTSCAVGAYTKEITDTSGTNSINEFKDLSESRE